MFNRIFQDNKFIFINVMNKVSLDIELGDHFKLGILNGPRRSTNRVKDQQMKGSSWSIKVHNGSKFTEYIWTHFCWLLICVFFLRISLSCKCVDHYLTFFISFFTRFLYINKFFLTLRFLYLFFHHKKKD